MRIGNHFDQGVFFEHYRRVVGQADLVDIDTFVRIAVESGAFSEEFHETALQNAMKSLMRKVIRRGLVDEGGRKLELINIEEVDPETNAIKQGWKQLEFLTLDNFEYAINDIDRRVGAEMAKRGRLIRIACKRFGKEAVQARLPLTFDAEPAI